MIGQGASAVSLTTAAETTAERKDSSPKGTATSWRRKEKMQSMTASFALPALAKGIGFAIPHIRFA